jgi:tetratricopeptide (TPR) repeat protein
MHKTSLFALTLLALAPLAGAVERADIVEVTGDEEPADAAGSSLPVESPPEDEAVLPAAEAPDYAAELAAEFRRYRELVELGSLLEADTSAKRIVELTIREHGPRSLETAKALNNLGIVQHGNEQYEAAIQNYEGAIEIIEDRLDMLDSNLVNPLKGLGAAQLANGRPDLALQTFKRAVHVTHVNEGPHNIEQVEILESIAETNLRVGETSDARDVHELIYNLNKRYYNGVDLVPSLMRRAEWQHRSGYYNDERATYRRVLNILEKYRGKNDLSLIEPYIRLGVSYEYVDLNNPEYALQPNYFQGEMFIKRAVRIAEDNETAAWQDRANTKLVLGDFYTKNGEAAAARRVYREVWEMLSDGEERLAHRARTLEKVNLLKYQSIPEFAGDASSSDTTAGDVDLREGLVAVRFTVSSRGRVDNVELIESQPSEFEDMLRDVQRQVRGRVYRPRFSDGQPVDTGNLTFTHNFMYRSDDLQARRVEGADGSR